MKWKKIGIGVCTASILMLGVMVFSIQITKEKEIVFASSSDKLGDVNLWAEAPVYLDEDGTLLLPVRDTVEALDGKVQWNQEERQMGIVYSGIRLTIEENNVDAVFAGNEITLSTAPQMRGNRLYLTSEVIEEIFGVYVCLDQVHEEMILRAGRTNAPILTKKVQEIRDEGRTLWLEIPVIVGLNDSAYGKSLNAQYQERCAQMKEAWLADETLPNIQITLQAGVVNAEVLSFYWETIEDGKAPSYQAENLDLLNQKPLSLEKWLDKGETTSRPGLPMAQELAEGVYYLQSMEQTE